MSITLAYVKKHKNANNTRPTVTTEKKTEKVTLHEMWSCGMVRTAVFRWEGRRRGAKQTGFHHLGVGIKRVAIL